MMVSTFWSMMAEQEVRGQQGMTKKFSGKRLSGNVVHQEPLTRLICGALFSGIKEMAFHQKHFERE